MTQKMYRVTGKDRMSDEWTVRDFTDRVDAEIWADARAWVQFPNGSDNPIVELEVSDR